MNKKIIYDLGSNNGDDIPYYLMRSDLVIAVEANPELCNLIKNRFAEYISNGRLIVENVVIGINDLSLVPFYVHPTEDIISSAIQHDYLKESLEILVPSKNIISLIQEHGDPYYIKIDIEGSDQLVLETIFSNNIFPPYISAESHILGIFNTFMKYEKYKKFKVVEGHWVSKVYKDRLYILQNNSIVNYSFPYHSAGPFGNDIDGPWIDKDQLWDYLETQNLGWKDIHASLVD
jgi:FkbM family methyltransferase